MVFFECYAFGRSANRALNVVTHACGNQYCVALSDQAKGALKFLKGRLQTAKPLLVVPALFDTWIIFTDGSCEAFARAGGFGGVLNPSGICVEHFSESVPRELLDSLLEASENPVYELELLPVLVLYRAWSSRMRGAQLVV